MATITVNSSQSIFDVALVAYQDASRIYDLLTDNPHVTNVNSDLTAVSLNYVPSVVIQNRAVLQQVVNKSAVTIGDAQSVFDIAVQYFGGAEFVYDFIDGNIESIIDDPKGINLNYSVSNLYLPLYFRKKEYNIGSKYPYTDPGNILLQDNGYSLLQDDGFEILI